ncbi:MAG: HEAT repeat domain-containing protein [Oscillospiraceae bacterium]|nr:HEAT repeat domain-containing protein [Oscillospiraceae bacterium]
MFGFNAESMVKRGKWEKLTAVVEKADMSKVPAIAAACAKSKEDGAYNTLITMLNSDNVECKINAVKALGEQGRPAAITQLMYQVKTATSEELKNAIAAALELLHNMKNDEE